MTPVRSQILPLMAIEGEDDDIAASGQTSAAHGLCSRIPDALKRRLPVPHCGHFSLFHGNKWRSLVLREPAAFIESAPRGKDKDPGSRVIAVFPKPVASPFF